MDIKKQAALAAALAKGVAVEIPELESQVPSFLRSMIPKITQDELNKAGSYLAAVAAKASDDWDAANAQKPAP